MNGTQNVNPDEPIIENENDRLQNMETKKFKRGNKIKRIDILAEPNKRLVVNLYEKYKKILDPNRVKRIQNKIDDFNKKTLE